MRKDLNDGTAWEGPSHGLGLQNGEKKRALVTMCAMLTTPTQNPLLPNGFGFWRVASPMRRGHCGSISAGD